MSLTPTEIAVLRAVARLEDMGRELLVFHTIYCASERDLGEPASRREHRRRHKAVERALTALESEGQLDCATFYLKHVWTITSAGRDFLDALDSPTPLRPTIRTRLSGLAERVLQRVSIHPDGVL